MKRVYVAGKLNADAPGYIRNCHTMIVKSERLRRYGFSVFVPCLDFLMGLVAGDYEYKDYFENNLPWIECADYMYVCPNYETSEGTKKEITYAKTCGVKVVYSMDELLKSEAK
jgi:hypothetical protein